MSTTTVGSMSETASGRSDQEELLQELRKMQEAIISRHEQALQQINARLDRMEEQQQEKGEPPLLSAESRLSENFTESSSMLLSSMPSSTSRCNSSLRNPSSERLSRHSSEHAPGFSSRHSSSEAVVAARYLADVQEERAAAGGDGELRICPHSFPGPFRRAQAQGGLR